MSDKYLKSLTFPDLADRYVVGDSSLSVSGAAADAKATGDALATKAEVDGAYESMTVGNAEQLVSSISKEDNAPYNFRTSGGSLDIGDREYLDKVVGGTVAWNQLEKFNRASGTQEGITFTNNNDGSFTLNGTCTANTPIQPSTTNSAPKAIAGHKYLGISDIQNPSLTGVFFGIYVGSVLRLLNGRASGILDNTYEGKIQIGYRCASGFEADNLTIKGALFDLTQMFGSTIADYIYSLEQATEGAGVAWFKKLFPKDYYAYNAGELISVKTSAHEMVGFNAWDEEWELGTISEQNGQAGTDNTRIRAKNYNPCVPNTAYYAKDPTNNNNISMRFYDADKNYIGYGSGWLGNTTFVTPAKCAYFKFVMGSAYGTTYNHDICINLSWSGYRNGEYEPYIKHSYPLDNSLTLRGIPKLDASNNLYYDGDEYESDGTVNRRFKKLVFDGTENWGKEAAGWQTQGLDVYYIGLGSDARPQGKQPSDGNVAGNIVCSDFTAGSYYDIHGGSATGKVGFTATGTYLEFTSTIASLADWKTALGNKNLEVVYELATPTTEEAEPYQNTQVVDDFGTEEFVDTRAVAVPVGHSTRYQPNLRAKLEMMPNSPDGDGDYIVRQTSGENEYVALASNATIQALMAKLPSAPAEDGTYKLTVTVTNGTAVYSWGAE